VERGCEISAAFLGLLLWTEEYINRDFHQGMEEKLSRCILKGA
jgi:hypothetical protein